MPSKQATFNKVVKCMIKQAKPALNDDNECAYRGENGLKCAAGWIIPDSMYDKEMEGENAKASVVSEVLVALKYDPDFVYELQLAHDEAADEYKDRKQSFVKTFKAKAKNVAKNYNLKTDILTTD